MHTDSPTAAPARWQERTIAVVALSLALVGLAAFVWRPAYPAPVGEVSAWMPAAVPNTAWDRLYLSKAAVAVLRPTLLVLLVATRPGRRALRRLTGWMSSSVVSAVLAAVFVLAAVDLVTLPISWWGRIANRGVVSWLAEWMLVRAQTWALIGLLAAGLAVAVRRWPRTWHWRAVLVGTALAAVIPLAADLDPFAGDLQPLPEGPSRTAVESAADRAGASDVPIRIGGSTAATESGAYVSGIGPSRSLVLSSALVERFPPDQIAFVAMHEFAHREHLDVYRRVLGTASGLAVGTWIVMLVLRRDAVRRQIAGATAPDVRRMVVILATVAVVYTLAAPVSNLASRRSEAAADWRALEVTEDPRSAIAIQRFIMENGGADPSPPAWYQIWLATHPSAEDRIGLAVRYAELRGATLSPAHLSEGRQAGRAHAD